MVGEKFRRHRYPAYVVYRSRRIPSIEFCIVSIAPSAYRSVRHGRSSLGPADLAGNRRSCRSEMPAAHRTLPLTGRANFDARVTRGQCFSTSTIRNGRPVIRSKQSATSCGYRILLGSSPPAPAIQSVLSGRGVGCHGNIRTRRCFPVRELRLGSGIRCVTSSPTGRSGALRSASLP
jgi:hypothetical protein